jgi:membrane protein
MNQGGIGAWGYIKRTFEGFDDDDAMTLGAAVAYYTTFSLAPVLLIATSVAGLILGRDTVQNAIQAQVQTLIGPGSAAEIKVMLAKASQSQTRGIVGTAVGIGVSVLGATGAFAALQDALNRIWHVTPDPRAGGIKSFLGKRILSFGMIMGVGFLLLVSLAISAVLAAAGTWIGNMLPMWISGAFEHGAGLAASFLAIAALFGAMFKVLPDVKLQWRDVWVGALATSLLFTVGKIGIGYYLGRSATASAYGAAGSFVVIVLWLYYASLILLFGAEFTKVWATEHNRRIEPEEGAMHVASPNTSANGYSGAPPSTVDKA